MENGGGRAICPSVYVSGRRDKGPRGGGGGGLWQWTGGTVVLGVMAKGGIAPCGVMDCVHAG